ncbi:hypothetical protein SKAU_G00014180 [Synaphobranchus kaupii]|uniref:Uncharacterized protein n=1 Tax=Synaphobranchus kaupii TaxID=118154 RepID=A0A9Q1JD95_SYNKA|nr:hypothetical protein SKAU_G00014180 [Synaphobranchus kaupii]
MSCLWSLLSAGCCGQRSGMETARRLSQRLPPAVAHLPVIDSPAIRYAANPPPPYPAELVTPGQNGSETDGLKAPATTPLKSEPERGTERLMKSIERCLINSP